MSDELGAPDREMNRKRRVTSIMVDSHATLRDRYHLLGLSAQLILLAASVVFCATTFASDELYLWFGEAPENARIIRGIASVFSFIASLWILLVDFKGKAALHGAAFDRWCSVNTGFREAEPGAGQEWSAEARERLSAAYWRADKESVKIPARQFNALKSQHLQKVAISKLKDRYPFCPRLILSLWSRWRHTRAAIKEISGADCSANGGAKGTNR